MKRNIQKILSIITAGCVMLPNMTYAFSDLTSKHWAYNAVDKMVEQELLSGYSDGTFRPDICITRAEFATILSKTLDIKENSKNIEFKDVEGIHWAEEYIDKVNSFLTGYMDNNEYYFKPEDAVLREDAAVAIVKAKGLSDEKVSMSILDSFKDKDSISDSLKKYVAIAVKKGFMRGNEDGTFNPQGNLTRAEIAALFDNAYEEIPGGVSGNIIPSDIRGLDCEEAVKKLISLDIIRPYEDGEFRPEMSITRAEMVVILCKMIGIDGTVIHENQYVNSRFSDVKTGEWYTGYINVAEGKGMLNGINEGKNFRPNDKITMNELLTICVNALGRGEYVSELGEWPGNYIAEATKLKLLDGVKTAEANRGNVAMVVWNTLKAPYVWDVTSTESNGMINFGNTERSLLNIHFSDFSL